MPTPGGWLERGAGRARFGGRQLPEPPVDTVFVGGGTPSLLGGDGLAAVLDAVRDAFVLADGAEVTTEANPESTSPEFFARIRAAGYTRVSLGMQSVAPTVLRMLDRVHSPGRPLDAAREALGAGFDHVNIDLIYGTPGESDDDLHRSVDAAIGAGIDHLSAYALVVEDGTALARRVRRGEIAARGRRRAGAPLRVARRVAVGGRVATGTRCRTGAGPAASAGTTSATGTVASGGAPGPGAHGFVGSTRWWNVKHPNAYAGRLAESALAGSRFRGARRAPTGTPRKCCCGIRLRDGLPLPVLRRRRAGPCGSRRRRRVAAAPSPTVWC